MKYRTSSSSDSPATSCVAMLLILAVCMAIGGLCWQWSINEWLVYAGKEPAVKFWHGALISIVPHLGGLSVGVAVLTWIIMLFL